MSGGAFGIAVPKADFSTTLGSLGKSFADQVDGVGKQMLARDLGEKVKAGDYTGAADAALKAGDLQTGLALVKLGESRGASKELATTLGGMFGGGADTSPTTGTTLGTMGQSYRDGGPKMPSFASTGGGMGDYLNTVRGVESGGSDTAKNPSSTATGRYQFTQDTWNGLARKYPDLGLTPNGRLDPAQQDRAMQAFTKDNADALTRAGVPITPGNLYVSHFLGEAGGPRFIAGAMSNPDAPATQFVDPRAAAANRTIFFNRDGSPKTAGEVYAERTGRFPGGAAPASPQPTQVATADPDGANKPTPDAKPAAFVIPGQDGQDAKAPASGVASMPVSVQLAGAGIPRQVAGAVGRAAPGSPERIGALIRASLIPGLSEQQQGVVKTLLSNEMEAGKLTSDQREYAMAQAQGFPGTFVDYKNTLSGRQAEGAKIAEQVAARQAETQKLGLDQNDPAVRRYNLTGQLAEEKPDKFTYQSMPGVGMVALHSTDPSQSRVIIAGQQPRPLTDAERVAFKIGPDQPAGMGVDGKPFGIGGAKTDVNVDTKGANKFTEEANRFQAERYGKMVTAADNAAPLRADIETMASLGSQISTGKLAEARLGLAQYAKSAGLDAIANSLTNGKMGEMEAFTALADKLTPQMRVPGSGSTSDAEGRAFKNSLPSLLKSPEGNAIIADTFRGLADYQSQAGDIAGKALRGEISQAEADQAIRALPSPYGRFKAYQGAQKATPDAAGSTGLPKGEARTPLPQGYSAGRAIAEAKAAVKSGKDPAPIREWLQARGIDPKRLDD